MCGKFTQMMSWSDLVALMRALGGGSAMTDSAGGDDSGDRVETATPMRGARIIARDANGERQVVMMRWGFEAPWERGKLVIHARCETVESLRTFRDAFAGRRGILVCRTFNEGEEVGSKTRQHVISPRDGRPLAIAVIYQQAVAPDGSPFWTFAMVTTPPNALIATITDRMPAVLRPGDWAQWLGEEPATTAELKAMLKPYEGDWEMTPQEPPRQAVSPKPPRAPRGAAKPSQGRLF